MPIKSAFWSTDRGMDLHVLKGQSTPDLSAAHVGVTKATGTLAFARSYLDDPANGNDITLVFRPLIKGVPAGDLVRGGGVEVNTKTGVVKAVNPLPSPHLHNFIMEALITNTADGKVYTLSIRIHIHESVTSFWLTPDILTVRPNGTTRPDKTKYQFTARAQFDDGTLGDLTENHGITWTPASLFDVNQEIVLRTGDNPGDPPITITVKLPAALGGTSDTAQLKVAQPWGDPTNATLVVGGGWPGAINPALVPNILFLCDGFTNTPADRDSFEQLSNSIVHRFKTNHLTTPFDRLATSINFWRTFIPSDVRGISVLCEVLTVVKEGEVRAFMVNNPKKPAAAGAWTLENVVYAVGLPVLADHTSNAAVRTDAQIRADWTALLTPDPSPNVTDAMLKAWRLLGNRTFIEEKDTPLCMSYGLPPQVDADSDTLLIDFHPRRLRRRRDQTGEDQSRFDRFLGSLITASVTDLGALWAEKARVRPANYEHIFILTSCKWDKGKNHSGYITMNVEELGYLTGITTVAGKNALQWNPPAPKNVIAGPRSGRALHELGHSFGLGDEYGGDKPTFTGTADELRFFGNLQAESDAKTGGEIKGDEIKWNWLRARKGAMVRATVTPAAVDRWIVKVKLGHGSQFATGDTLILRKRHYPLPLGKKVEESSLLTVAETPTVDQVIVTGTLPLGVVFVEGDVLYMPTEAPASVKSPIYPFAELVALNIKDLITAEKRALSPAPCTPTQSKLAVQVPNLSTLVTHLTAANLPTIVGLYDGGRQIACGIFHPAGACMMNSGYDVQSFCAVCRYLLVESINPFTHFEIDREYDAVYPQP